ncbi:hypothetical protein N7466_006622 [Penicillium verhagenii]|uniref:uncharacterized protein n=1 Tax=Penicillium verhagenii TaxID=1562060 RepID=UPI002545BDC0|nr:uncharacterized protein N7466_006622 [Penicillium verhagenii]KAJ5931129.1 hypothetical protein N7466_006622 [Penicillium verhagenii]
MHFHRKFLLIAGLVPGLISASSLSRSGIVDLGYSEYQGITLDNGVDEFLGIRYARPPLDELRFRAPQDPEATTGVLDASSFGPVCVGVGQSASTSLAEDCLFVNIWRPNNASTKANLPVWVFISGGGYADLSNANYNGSEVVQQSGHDIVLVNFNYRVGVLGFLASEEVRKGGDLNVGLLDQRKLLSWVQQNIHLFGGNPDHVVIHGDSAGAGSVAHHITAYGGRDMKLFAGAVAESNFWPTQRTVAEMEFQYTRFAQDVGCDTSESVLSCLRAVDIQTIQDYDVDEPFPGGSSSPAPLWYFLPVVDGDLVPDILYNLFESGKVVHVPVMVSDDTNEGTAFAVNATSAAEVAQFMKNNYPGLTEDQLDTINQEYPLTTALPKHAAYFPSAAGAYGDSTFTCPGNFMSASMARFVSSDQVWNYRCNILDPTDIADGLGVPHVFEMPAVFGLGETNEASSSFATTNADIVPVIMDYYLSFVKALNPNIFRNDNAPVWNSWGTGTGERLRLQTNSTAMEEVPQTQVELCAMWQKLATTMEQ